MLQWSICSKAGIYPVRWTLDRPHFHSTSGHIHQIKALNKKSDVTWQFLILLISENLHWLFRHLSCLQMRLGQCFCGTFGRLRLHLFPKLGLWGSWANFFRSLGKHLWNKTAWENPSVLCAFVSSCINLE